MDIFTIDNHILFVFAGHDLSNKFIIAESMSGNIAFAAALDDIFFVAAIYLIK